jgi:hypothetical protein
VARHVLCAISGAHGASALLIVAITLCSARSIFVPGRISAPRMLNSPATRHSDFAVVRVVATKEALCRADPNQWEPGERTPWATRVDSLHPIRLAPRPLVARGSSLLGLAVPGSHQ